MSRLVRRSRLQASFAHTPYARRLRIESLEDRRMLAVLVGVDFGGGFVPTNWSSVLTVAGAPGFTTRSNLIDETGAATQFDLQISTTFAGGANNDTATPLAATIPQHTQSLVGIDRLVYVDSGNGNHSFNATWSDLNPAATYEVYVFGLESIVEGTPFVDNQQVTIAGAGAPIVFNQNPVSLGNLWVNDQIGSSAQTLESYRKLLSPTASGEIDITIALNPGSDSVVLSGLAIREVGILVNNIGDVDDMNSGNGVTTLREAIRLANTTPGADKILFSSLFDNPQTINISSQLPTITDAVIIEGPGRDLLTINAGGNSRLFYIDNGNFFNPIDVTIAGVTLTGGKTADGALGQDGEEGGAIYSRENLTIRDATLTGNRTGDGGKGDPNDSDRDGKRGGRGGAIFTDKSLTIIGSKIIDNRTGDGGDGAFDGVVGGSGNQGGEGGAIYVQGSLSIESSLVESNRTGSGGMATFDYAFEVSPAGNGGSIALFNATATITGSTIANNSTGPLVNPSVVGGRGGGVDSNAGSSLTINNSTISGNTAHNAGGLYSDGNVFVVEHSTITNNTATNSGGGIQLDFPNNFVGHSIVAGNFAPNAPDYDTGNANMVNVNYSLIGDTSGSIIDGATGAGNLLDVAALLGPLADNGGPTFTHALLPGSPALNTGNPNPNTGNITIPLLDDFSANNFATNYNFVDLFSAANNAPQVSGGEANLNVGSGTGAFVWNQGDSLQAIGDVVSVDFGFNYPIPAGGFAESSAGLALFGSVTGSSPLAEIRVETNKLNASTLLDLVGGSAREGLSGTPVGLMNLAVTVTGQSATTTTIEIKLSGTGFNTITQTSTLAAMEIFFGPVAFDVTGTASVHDNLRFLQPFDQRGPGFPRVFGGQIDIGAYEAQITPSADFDSDGDIDGRDFLTWQRGFGKANAMRADGNSDDDTDVDGSDLASWQVSYSSEVCSELIVEGLESEERLAVSDQLSASDIIDLALASEWLGVRAVVDEVLVRDDQPILETAFDAVHGLGGDVVAAKKQAGGEALRGDSGEDDSAEETWLSEEMLEKIFV